VSRTSKKPKPTFDVARDPIADTRSGWVYRSDPLANHDPEPPTIRTPQNGERFEPAAPPQPAPRSWLYTGVYLMVLPVTIGMTIMFAPVSWMLGSRSRH
jgi:hypothetical protein